MAQGSSVPKDRLVVEQEGGEEGRGQAAAVRGDLPERSVPLLTVHCFC